MNGFFFTFHAKITFVATYMFEHFASVVIAHRRNENMHNAKHAQSINIAKTRP